MINWDHMIDPPDLNADFPEDPIHEPEPDEAAQALEELDASISEMVPWGLLPHEYVRLALACLDQGGLSVNLQRQVANLLGVEPW